MALHKIWPSAPLYTSVYDPQGAPWAKNFKVIPSFLQKLAFARKRHELYPWLMPLVFESFNFNDFEVVISVTSAEAKGVITQPQTFHLCYCLTPTRYLWSSYKDYLGNPRYGILNPIIKPLMKPMLKKLKEWDRVAAQRPDCYFAISKTVQKRIAKYYHRKADLIYPPLDGEKFKPSFSSEKDYFLLVARLVPYKKVELAVKAFNKLKLPLKIIGAGTERKILEKKARANIEFLGQKLTDAQLISYYQNCSALIFTAKEDLGLVALEAQACGRPVIGYKKGGVEETVIEGKTGLLFSPQTSEALIKAIGRFKKQKFDRRNCRENALKFKEENFLKKFKFLVEDRWRQYQKTILR